MEWLTLAALSGAWLEAATRVLECTIAVLAAGPLPSRGATRSLRS